MLHVNRIWFSILFLVSIGLAINTFYARKKPKHKEEAVFLARVGKNYLHESDLPSLSNLGSGLVDRTLLKNQYVEEWVYKQLLIEEGSKDYQSIQPCLEEQLNAFKDDLLAYHFSEAFVNRTLHNEVSSEEIEAYYQQHKENDFLLNHDIVRGIFLALPKRLPGINSIKSWMLSKRPDCQSKLRKYVQPYNETVIVDSDKWFPWEEVLATVGYRPSGDAVRILRANKFIHVVGRKYVYLLKLDQYKTAQEIAPLDVVVERVKAIILHKRKLELINKIKHDLLQDAKKNHTCVIHVK